MIEKSRQKRIIRKKNEKGITLIALVITIIVLLILAGVSIATLTGDNGLLTKANEAKNASEIAEEKDKVGMIAHVIKIEKIQNGEIDEETFQKLVDTEFGTRNAQGSINDTNYIVEISQTGNIYEIDRDGNVEEIGNSHNMGKDENPGVLEGEGSESNPYLINSIEDLVAFSYQVNSGSNLYEGETVALGRSLYFNGLFNSYANENATYKVTEQGYIPDAVATTTIKEIVTTDKGFIPIGNKPGNTFKGNFDGKDNYLDRIYINTDLYAGFFGIIENEMVISNFGIKSGQIHNTSNVATGGVIGQATAKIYMKNCYNGAEIKGLGMAGGLIGFLTTDLEISDCYNTNKIYGESITGGIIGFCINDIKMEKCYNLGNIIKSNVSDPKGGLIGRANNAEIQDSYNKGNIEAVSTAAGIISSVVGNVKIQNCFNMGNLKAEEACGISYSMNNLSNIVNCFNTGTITGKSCLAGIVGRDNSANRKGVVSNCYNLADIVSEGTGNLSAGIAAYIYRTENCYNRGNINNNNVAGGIAIEVSEAENCYNSGNIEGNGLAGGIVTQGIAADFCYNSGNISGSYPVGGILARKTESTGRISNAYNIGNINGDNKNFIGEIIGTGTVEDTCYYSIKSNNAVANGAVGKTEEEMKNIMDIQNFVNRLNTKVEENNNNPENIKWKKWKVYNGIPVFAE